MLAERPRKLNAPPRRSISSGNTWNVRIGITVAKMYRMEKIPAKLQLGIDATVRHRTQTPRELRIRSPCRDGAPPTRCGG